ncbi:hypothetical protein KC19_VG298000 [Ceratodon purpureus]|uniref:Uncharacterized protein n=1 Tax=Ceratodon purpureus TaxID=3225 RepID=A0A8T0HWM7_CERPU|nr:hypothetical protein KC19_VG298000 [Ceratodon purpureus]
MRFYCWMWLSTAGRAVRKWIARQAEEIRRDCTLKASIWRSAGGESTPWFVVLELRYAGGDCLIASGSQKEKGRRRCDFS